LDAVVDLEGGLPLEVEISPKSFARVWIGFVEALDVRRQSLAADVVLDEDASQLQSCLTKQLIQSSPPSNATTAT
jgi:hypothetical protein